MTKEELIIKLTAIVKPYIQNEEAFKGLNENTDFINDLEINSANLVDVILDVEDEFNIEIDNDSMEKMLSVKATIEIIQIKMNRIMVGNDLVDLQIAKSQSNWRRKGFLEKQFTIKEQQLILQNG